MKAAFAALALIALASPAAGQEHKQFLANCASASDRGWCDIQQKEFAKWYPQAMRGNYQGQRNVAFCLHDGCDGAVQKRPTLACAWRLVIIVSGSLELTDSDTQNLNIACGSLSQAERIAAQSQAERLVLRIKR